MSMKHVIGNGTGAAISPATAMSAMISAGSGTG
jgi:hypothetical protein